MMRTNIDFFTLRENARWISILFLGIAALKFGGSVVELAVFWCVDILLVGNVRRISDTKPIPYFVRMTGYFFPYLLPIVLGRYEIQNSDFIIRILIGCGISVIAFFVWLFIYRKKIRIMLSNHLALFSEKEPKWKIFIRIYNVLCAAISEELFFRGYILGLPVQAALKVGISILLFPLAHIILPWGDNYTKKDVYNQFLIGSISVIVYYVGLSVVPCVVLHLLINSIAAIKYYKVYDRYYKRKDNYEVLLDEVCFFEKEL